MRRGELLLNDLIGRHLLGTWEAWKDIARRHLLTHRSGIKSLINERTASLRWM